MHHARETLKKAGYRLTPQRTSIWEVVRRGGRHLTAEQIAAQVRQTMPEVNLSTVYRTLELLVSLGLVYETRLGTATTYYEVAPEPVHHHFVCEKCGAVGHFGDELFASLYVRLKAEKGFDASRVKATVFGVCQDCQRSNANGRASLRLLDHDSAPSSQQKNTSTQPLGNEGGTEHAHT